MARAEEVAAVLDAAVVCDMTLPWFEPYMIDQDVTLPKFHSAGFDFVSLTVSMPKNSLAETMRHIAKVKAHIASRPGLVFAASADEILAAKRQGRLALGFHFQGTEPFDGDIELVQSYYDLGVRHALLAYNLKNLVGDGCVERTDAGLSKYGINLVKEMNRVGMLVDGSHTGYRTTMDAMEVCERPFIFSHSNCDAVVPHYRNIKDDQIKACARSGGLIGINGVNEFLGDIHAKSETMFRHLEHIVNLAGIDHAGIGLDYVRDVQAIWDWIQRDRDLWPQAGDEEQPYPAHAQPEQVAELVGLMLDHGYKRDDVAKVLGGNFLRVMRAAENRRN
ncbi:dipeptidase [Dongia sp.]|uniref:dipeptidase n=1 Tax=Dongia sp. TaxID=1977262 RepID=UPI003752528A